MVQHTYEVDGIKLDQTNQEFFDYARLVLENTPRQVVYLTGKAGTGKTTFLKYIINRLKYQNNESETKQSYIILAPTGVAAVNAHGQTIHSFFKLPLGVFLPQDEHYNDKNIREIFKYTRPKIELIQDLSFLIIDEISMVRCDILDIIDKILRVYRGNTLPFGGVKVLLVGDAFQLSPIASNLILDKDTNSYITIRQLLRRQGYESEYFFDSKAYIDSKPYPLELTKPYRQTELEFINILNKARVKNLGSEDIALLNKRCCEPTELAQEDLIYLAPTNEFVDAHNQNRYNALDGEEREYCAQIEGDFPSSLYPVEKLIKLKIGVQVMIRKNHINKDNPSVTYYNGTIGKVVGLNDDSIIIRGRNPLTNEDTSYEIERAEWKNIEYTWNQNEKKMEEKTLGVFTQFPIKIAWAITIHKSQGLTFDHVKLSLTRCFAPGQAYVALSRCRQLNGIFLDQQIGAHIFKIDPRVTKEMKAVIGLDKVKNELINMDANKLYALARKALMENQPDEILTHYNEARRYRDDYDTKDFNKYIGHIVQLLHGYKGHRDKLLAERSELLQIKEQLNAYRVIYTAINERYNNIKAELERLQSTCDIQRDVIATQNKTNEELNVLLANTKTAATVEKAVLSSKIDGYKEIIIRNEVLLENKQKEITTLSEQNSKITGEKEWLAQEFEKTTKELERVCQIKWWQKLFGKK